MGKFMIYNTFTRKKEEFTPIHKGFVGMYVCGPTVYGMPHLGHAKSYTNFDTIFRFLKFQGNKVKYVQNITDVGHLVGDGDDGQDKIAKQALIEKLDPFEIAYKYEVEFFKCMDLLNVQRPSISCRATGFIMEMIDAVKDIINKGYGYVTDQGNVYFDVRKYKNYGQLSHRTLDNNVSGERIEIANDKKNPEDFALWKSADETVLMKWQSPWGVGCPGWHLECTVLSKKFLGDHFDIHGGGIDNLFPHHECECAQADVVNGRIPMNFFMHNGLVTVNGVKMGKSLGNFITLENLFKQYNPITVRYFINQFHYRSSVDFREDGLKLAEKQFAKISESVSLLRSKVRNVRDITIPEYLDLYNKCISAMEDDFNTPIVVAEFLQMPRLIAKAVENNDVVAMEQLNKIVTDIGESILGLIFTTERIEESIPDKIKNMAEERWQAKKEKNWNRADELRNQLKDLGYEILDAKEGYEIKKI